MKQIGRKDESISQEIIRINENDKLYRHKIVDGPKQVHTVFYPTVGDDGKVKKMVVPVASPWKNLFSPLAEIDVRIKKSAIFARNGQTEDAIAAAKKVRSELSASSSYHCLILDKGDDVPMVRHAEYKYSVYRKLLALEQERAVNDRSQKDEAHLRYGLLFMFWVEISRSRKGESKLEQYDTEYSVKVWEKMMGDWENAVPSYLLNCSQTINSNGTITLSSGTRTSTVRAVDMGMFTEEEFQALVNYPNNLDELVVSFTDEQALEKLQSYPLKLDATDEKGNFLLPDWQQIKEELEAHQVELPYTVDTKKLSAPKAETPEPDEEAPPKKKKTAFEDDETPPKKKKTVFEEEETPPATKKKGNPFEDAEDIEGEDVSDDPLAKLLT